MKVQLDVDLCEFSIPNHVSVRAKTEGENNAIPIKDLPRAVLELLIERLRKDLLDKHTRENTLTRGPSTMKELVQCSTPVIRRGTTFSNG